VGCAKCINVYRDAAAMGNLLFVSRSAQPASSTTTQFDSLHSRALLMLNTLLSLSLVYPLAPYYYIVVAKCKSSKSLHKTGFALDQQGIRGGKVLSYLLAWKEVLLLTLIVYPSVFDHLLLLHASSHLLFVCFVCFLKCG
jgi:hypothetical protein